MPLVKLLFLALPFVLCAAVISNFTGRSAWTLDTPQLRVTMLQGGGHIAEISLKDGIAINPLWVQSRPTIDPMNFVAARDADRYGGGSGAKLMSGLAGHNLCFPFWGDPSPAEARAGMTYHGEAGVAPWRQTGSGGDWMEAAAELPESRTRVTRRITVTGPVVWFDETATNEAAWDRPVGWCEHVTMGSPFLERGVTQFAASATKGRVSGDWPQGTEDGHTIDLSTVRKVNAGGSVNNYLVNPAHSVGWFTAYSPKHRLVFGYAFRRAEFPWLNVWESMTPELFTRGMEFSNTPSHGTTKVLVATRELFGTPAYEWLDARSSLRKRYCAFSIRVPESFHGVEDIRIAGGKLTLLEKQGGPGLTVDLGAEF